MSSLAWRREQPRVEPPVRSWDMLDTLVVGLMTSSIMLQIMNFVASGEWSSLLAIMAIGWQVARFYPFPGTN
jgi:uncharacterized paraquat-inducible protein A